MFWYEFRRTAENCTNIEGVWTDDLPRNNSEVPSPAIRESIAMLHHRKPYSLRQRLNCAPVHTINL
jgi:hypothetical protein